MIAIVIEITNYFARNKNFFTGNKCYFAKNKNYFARNKCYFAINNNYNCNIDSFSVLF